MLIWFYGSTMILGARVTMPSGALQGGATVTYALRNRQGEELYSGTLTEIAEPDESDPDAPNYEDDRIDPEEVFGEYWEEQNPEELRRQLHEARIIATLPNGVLRESRPRLQLTFDTD